MADARDDELVGAYGTLGDPVVVYGHIHKPFVRRIGQLTVANSGSVGLPYDGDQRASYVVIEGGHVSIRRVKYDVEQEIRALHARHYPHAEWLAPDLANRTLCAALLKSTLIGHNRSE